MEDYQPIQFDFLDEDVMVIKDYETPGPNKGPEPGSQWKLIFDSSSNAEGRGIGDVITSPTCYHIHFTSR